MQLLMAKDNLWTLCLQSHSINEMPVHFWCSPFREGSSTISQSTDLCIFWLLTSLFNHLWNSSQHLRPSTSQVGEEGVGIKEDGGGGEGRSRIRRPGIVVAAMPRRQYMAHAYDCQDSRKRLPRRYSIQNFTLLVRRIDLLAIQSRGPQSVHRAETKEFDNIFFRSTVTKHNNFWKWSRWEAPHRHPLQAQWNLNKLTSSLRIR